MSLVWLQTNSRGIESEARALKWSCVDIYFILEQEGGSPSSVDIGVKNKTKKKFEKNARWI